jgi:hypothetical protein
MGKPGDASCDLEFVRHRSVAMRDRGVLSLEAVEEVLPDADGMAVYGPQDPWSRWR